MGKQTPRLVIAVLIICGLVILALQNASPSLALVFLGVESITLPLGVWLSGAIALGALTAIALMAVSTGGGPSVSRGNRRRWTVHPNATPPQRDRNPDPVDRMAREPPPHRWTAPEPTPPPRASQPPTSGRTSRSTAPVGTTAAAEDWQTWEQRSPPSQWDDWSQANGNPAEEPLSKRQRQDRQKATTTIQDLEKGWDDSAQDTVYVAPGGSQVEDVLDDIADGWEDWDAEDNPLADTAYAQRYEGEARQARRDAIYAPPDDADGGGQDWQNEPANPSPPAANSEDEANVYDADYRVIIPPYQPLDESESEGDRPA